MEASRPWVWVAGMFLRPRHTIEAVLARGSVAWGLAVAAGGGAVGALQQAAALHPARPSPPMMAMLLVAGAILGVAWLYPAAWLMALTGRWMGGRAEGASLRMALAWGGVPSLALGLVWLLRTGLAGWPGTATQAPAGMALLALAGLASLTLNFWSLLATVAAVSQVQRFSSGRAAASALAAGVLAVAILLAAVVALALLRDG